MRTYEPYKDMPDSKLYDHYEAVSVAAYIKHVMLVACIVSVCEILSDVSEVFPMGFLCCLIPALQCDLGILAPWHLVELAQFSV